MYKDAKNKKKYNSTKRGKDGVAKGRNDKIKTSCEDPIVNNPEWRKFSDLLANQVNSFPFTSIAGGASTINCIPKGSVKGVFNPAAVMRFDVNPSIGYSNGETSSANQAARYLYTKLSANNMKTTQYGPQDVLIALLSLGEVVSISAYCRRALGMLGTINPRNWYYPKSIIEAMGITYDDFVKNASIYRTRYNYIVAVASAIAFPANIKYFDSCRALFNDVFLDHTTGLAQTYMFVPATYWTLNELAEGGSRLETTEFVPPILGDTLTPPTNNFSIYLDKLEGVINNLMTSATLQYLYADVLKYVGNNGGALLSIETVADDYSVIPVYSEEVLGWIENSIIMGYPVNSPASGFTPKNDVLTDAGNNTLKYCPVFDVYGLGPDATLEQIEAEQKDISILLDPILNFHSDEPSVDERIIATRFVPGRVSVGAVNNNKVSVTAVLPDHYIVQGCVMGMNKNVNGDFVPLTRLGPGFQVNDYYSSLFLFHRRPRFTIGKTFLKDGKTFELDIKNVACELDNYTVVDSGVVGSIQEVSNLALFRF